MIIIMLVKDLIKQLEKEDPNTEVFFIKYESYVSKIICVHGDSFVKDGKMTEPEDDINLYKKAVVIC